MSEAAVPSRPPTLRQERLAEALLDPNVKTYTEAMQKAGYSPATARSSPGRQRSLAGTQTAIQAKERERADKARGILNAGLAEMAKRMPTAQDAGVAAFTKVAADVVSSGVVEEATSHLDRARAERVRRRYGRFCYFLGRKSAESQLGAAHNLDIIDVTADTTEG